MSKDDLVPPGTRDSMDGDASAHARMAELDVEKYRPYVEAFDLSEAQKVELLTTLWSIMRSFVEMGFSVNLCDPIIENFKSAATAPADGVQSEDTATSEGLSNAKGP
ncbi:MAG: hypothetical protein WDN25_13610 [Acetobacteraceae bacterium]